jgi:deaminated glutathione amidase
MTHMAAIQMTSSQHIDENLLTAGHLIQKASLKAKLVVLPENFAIMGLDPMDKVKIAEAFGQGKIQDFLSHTAKKNHIWLVGGTIPLKNPDNPKKTFSACLVYDDQGICVARYDKIHLFDVDLLANQERHRESDTITPGNQIMTVDTPYGKLGLAICYDLRFPELFRKIQLSGAEIVALPSAFTYITGLAHWDILIRARAIENQMYMIASAQTGLHTNQRKTYGHSMIVNPWGEVKASLSEEVDVICGQIDLAFLHQLRGDFPVLKHQRYS